METTYIILHSSAIDDAEADMRLFFMALAVDAGRAFRSIQGSRKGPSRAFGSSSTPRKRRTMIYGRRGRPHLHESMTRGTVAMTANRTGTTSTRVGQAA